MNGQWRLSPSFERWLYGMAAAGFLTLATGLFYPSAHSLLMAASVSCALPTGILFVAILYASGAPGVLLPASPPILPYGALSGRCLPLWIFALSMDSHRGEIPDSRRSSELSFLSVRAVLYVALWLLFRGPF